MRSSSFNKCFGGTSINLFSSLLITLPSLFQQMPLNYSKYVYWRHLWTSEHKSTCCDQARSDNTLPCLLEHASNKRNPLNPSGLCYKDWIIICFILARTVVYYAELLIKCCVYLVGASCLDSLYKATLGAAEESTIATLHEHLVSFEKRSRESEDNESCTEGLENSHWCTQVFMELRKCRCCLLSKNIKH
jgi:hypothetical protein